MGSEEGKDNEKGSNQQNLVLGLDFAYSCSSLERPCCRLCGEL